MQECPRHHLIRKKCYRTLRPRMEEVKKKSFRAPFFSFAGALIAEEYARLAPPENACLPPTYPYVNSCLRLLLAQFK